MKLIPDSVILSDSKTFREITAEITFILLFGYDEKLSDRENLSSFG